VSDEGYDQVVALYARVSTDEQNVDRQIEDARDYAESTYADAEIVQYPDIISGAAEQRGEYYDELWSDIADDDLDAVVIHELSRLSRLGAGAIHEFLEHCLEHDTSVKDLEIGLEIDVDSSMVDRAMKQMLAGIMGDLARVEHKQKLRRINSGIQAAQNAGKWTGRAPRGFYVGDEDQRLHVDTEEFLRTRAALERCRRDEAVAAVADDVGLPESSLRYILGDEERRAMYFHGEHSDERKQAALDEIAPLPEVDVDDDQDLEGRVAELEQQLETLANGE
jgi:DNA invertase Pin-like site-specific DNA recombinase